MKIRKSIRRVGNALVATGVLTLSLVTLSQVTFECSTERNGCLAAAVSFVGPQSVMPKVSLVDTTAVSTVLYGEGIPSVTDLLFKTIQVTSVYLILLGVGLLVLLELRELHYLRLLTRKMRRAH